MVYHTFNIIEKSKKHLSETNQMMQNVDIELTFPFNPRNSGEFIMASAGARNTKDGPCMRGNLDPKFA